MRLYKLLTAGSEKSIETFCRLLKICIEKGKFMTKKQPRAKGGKRKKPWKGYLNSII